MIGDRVLRPAMVAVSKAAAKSASSANDNPQPGDRSNRNLTAPRCRRERPGSE